MHRMVLKQAVSLPFFTKQAPGILCVDMVLVPGKMGQSCVSITVRTVLRSSYNLTVLSTSAKFLSILGGELCFPCFPCFRCFLCHQTGGRMPWHHALWSCTLVWLPKQPAMRMAEESFSISNKEKNHARSSSIHLNFMFYWLCHSMGSEQGCKTNSTVTEEYRGMRWNLE